jgi:hypothetical protein
MIRNLVLAGALALAVAAPAGATTVITQTPPEFLPGSGMHLGTFDLSPYLSDGQGRTFAIASATLSARAHSDPHYATPTITVTDTELGSQFSFNPLSINYDVLRVRTISYIDDVADRLTLSAGFVGGQSATGSVSQIIDTTEIVDNGFVDGPAVSPIPGVSFPFPTTQHTILQDRIVHRAIHGDLNLAFALDGDNLDSANFQQAFTYFVSPFAGGFPDFEEFLNPGTMTLDSVSFAFDLVQTGGPPPVAPVPEPATWALMILGFGLAGAALRRRAVDVPARD